MSMMTRSCPFCNADSPIPAGTRDGQRVWCVRCGEAFAYRGPTVSEGVVPIRNEPEPVRPSNRKVAFAVLGVMAFMATLGVIYAVSTVHFRRSNDRPKTNRQDDVLAVRTVAPSELAGLRYLPTNTHIVAGLHVAELLEEPNGRKFLARFNPSELLPRNPGVEVTANLEKATGLRLDDLDHLILGLTVEGRLTPTVTLIAQSRRPLDPTVLRTALKATVVPESGGRPVYRFKPEQPFDTLWPDAMLWLADERTVVVREMPTDGKASLPEPANLPRSLQTLLKERIDAVTSAWIVGQVDWNKTGLRLLLPTMPVAERETLEKLRSFAGSVQLTRELTVRGVFESADASAAERLERYLTPPAGERKPLRLLGGRPDAAELAQELAESRKVTRDDTWVTLQARARPETVQKAFED